MMTKKMSKALAATLGGEAKSLMPQSRGWGVLATRADGALVSIEDHGGWAYRDRAAYDRQQMEGDSEGLIVAHEWKWAEDDWCDRLSAVLGATAFPEHTGGWVMVVNYVRPDGQFAVIGDDWGKVYLKRKDWYAEDYHKKGEHYDFS